MLTPGWNHGHRSEFVDLVRQAALFDRHTNKHNLAELARRLDLPLKEIQNCPIAYQEFNVAKKSGFARNIAAPAEQLKFIRPPSHPILPT